MFKLLSRSILLSSVAFFSLVSFVYAHFGDASKVMGEVIKPTLEETVRSNSLKVVFFASVVLTVAVILTIIFRDKGETVKKILFGTITVPVILATLFMAGSTFYLNFQSISGGPVHWHAEYEIWDCGKELDLTDPEGFTNKIGSSSLHEHNDNWIHLEGVVTSESEATLGNYFKSVGGSLSNDGFKYPTSEGLVARHDGDVCSNGFPGTLQVFVYQTVNKVFTQKKLEDPENYVLSPAGNIPPGDCIIFEFDPVIKDKTDNLCEQYELQVLKGTLYGN